METTRLVIKELFDESSFFHIPAYQRPYVWTEQQVEQLILDIKDAKDQHVQHYFLGSIVLITNQAGHFDIVDGQQRITSLTILFAVLRELFQERGDHRLADEIHAYIHVERKRLSRINGGPRLSGVHCVGVFHEFIQKRGNLHQFFDEYYPTLFTEERYQQNARRMYAVLNAFSLTELIGFTEYVLSECMLIRISTPNNGSAFQIFNSLNGRGTPLSSIDMLKAEILSAGNIGNQAERERVETLWQMYEDSLGIDKFKELFHHMYVIESNKFVKAETFVTDFMRTFTPTSNPPQFFDNHFFPCARAMKAIVESDIDTMCKDQVIKEEINKMLWLLNHNEYEQWIPATIYYLLQDSTSADKLNFLKKMERLWAYHLLKRTRIDERKTSCLQLLTALQHNDQVAVEHLLNLTHIIGWEDDMRTIIDSPLYFSNYNACKYLLLRINCGLAHEAQAWRINDTTLSIEHILPKTPTPYWSSRWVTNSYKAHLHKIGNLTLLTRKINSQVQNSSFEEKKQNFLSDHHEHRISSLPITVNIQQYTQWTVEEFRQRQNEFCQRLCDAWEINTNAKSSKKKKPSLGSNNGQATQAKVIVTPKSKEKKEQNGMKRGREDNGLLDETAQSEPAPKRQKTSDETGVVQFPSIQESHAVHAVNNKSEEKSPGAKAPKNLLRELLEANKVAIGDVIQVEIEGYKHIKAAVEAGGLIKGLHPRTWLDSILPAYIKKGTIHGQNCG